MGKVHEPGTILVISASPMWALLATLLQTPSACSSATFVLINVLVVSRRTKEFVVRIGRKATRRMGRTVFSPQAGEASAFPWKEGAIDEHWRHVRHVRPPVDADGHDFKSVSCTSIPNHSNDLVD